MIQKLFVNNVAELWQNSTYFMLQVSGCKRAIKKLPLSPNPYKDSWRRELAFWRVLIANYYGDSSYRPLLVYD